MGHDTSSLSQQALSSWKANAQAWDAQITPNGNKYWRHLQEPCLRRLLGAYLSKSGGCRALDLATGNGLCARWMASLMDPAGKRDVLATDGAESMLDVARIRVKEAGLEGVVRFRKVDVTSKEDLVGLVRAEGKWDVVLMNMALMDVGEVWILAKTLPHLLRKGGVFVATLLHPAFFTSKAAKNVEVRINHETGEFEILRSIVVREYMNVAPYKGVAVVGQPEKQIYFHRPMHELFGVFFREGLVMDALEELAFPEEAKEEKVTATVNFTQFPVILAFRLRLP